MNPKKRFTVIVSSVLMLLGMASFCLYLFFNGFKADEVIPLGTTQVANLTDNRADYPNSQIPKYEKFELTFDLSGNGVAGVDYNPYSPNFSADNWSLKGLKIDGNFVSPSGQEKIWPGFYFQDYDRTKNSSGDEILTPKGVPAWKIRFAPTETGNWSYSIRVEDSSGATNTQSYNFSVVDNTNNKGFIHLSESDNSYYELGDNVFIGNGKNVSWWDGPKKTYDYDAKFDELVQNNSNMTRVWMNNEVADDTYAGNIEDGTNGLNKYDLDDAWRYDYIIDLAKNKGIYVRLSLFNIVNFVDGNWDRQDEQSNPYSVANGGMSIDRNDFFTNPDAKEYQKRLFRYLSARYGYSTALQSWELWNEQYNGVWNGLDGNNMVDWDKEMNQYFKSVDTNHLVSTSSQSGVMQNASDWWKALDDADGHPFGYNTEEINLFMGGRGGKDMSWEMPYYIDYVNSLKGNAPAKKNPVLFGEWTLADPPVPQYDHFEKEDTEGVAYQTAIWSSSMINGFGGLLSWSNVFSSKGFNKFWAGEKPYNMKSVRNLVYNSGFEQENSIWSDESQWGSSSVWSVVSDEKHSGSQSIKFQGSEQTTAGWWGIQTPQIVFKPNTTYTLSGWIKTQDMAGPVFMLAGAGADPAHGAPKFETAHIGNLKDTNDWTYVSGTITTPATVVDPNLSGHGVGIYSTSNSGTAWFDDICLTEGTEEEKIINSSPSISVHALKDQNKAYLWLQNREYSWWNVVVDKKPLLPQSSTVTIPNMTNGKYKVEWWNTSTGVIENTELRKITGNSISLTVNNLVSDVAVKIYPFDFTDTPVADSDPTPTTPPASTDSSSYLVLPVDRFSAKWNMVSFPDTSGSVSNGSMGMSRSEGFRIRSYDGANNSYQKGDIDPLTLIPGKGYWLNIDDINKVNGLKYPLSSSSSTEIAVTKGWNLLGNPYQSDLPLSNLKVKYKDGTTRSYSDAIVRKEVSGYAWSYEGSEKKYYFIAINPNNYKTDSPKSTVIKPFRGFWSIIKSDNIGSVIISK